MQIGWAATDITPERPVILRGQFHSRVSQRVNDPLWATVLVLADEKGEQAIMVSCDRVSISALAITRLRQNVAAMQPEIDPAKIFFNATHTHTAPEMEENNYPPEGPEVTTPTEYLDFFCERVSNCIVRAWQQRAPGGISWGFGHAVVGHNRRTTYFDGSSRMYGTTNQEDFAHMEGYEDHGVEMLFTWDAQQRLTGMILNLACPSQVTEGEYYVSADFWHEVRGEISKRYGGEVFVLPQCSAAGDQSPHLLLHNRAEERMRSLRGVTEREEVARRIAHAVEDVLPLTRAEIHTNLPLGHQVCTLELAARKVTAAEKEDAVRRCTDLERQQPDPADRVAFSQRYVQLNRYRRVIERFETQGENPVFPIEMHLIRVGDVAFATNPFELFLDFGLRIKARSKALQTFVVQLAGGKGPYLPTARAMASNGYGAEAVDNLVGPEGGQLLVEKSLAGINALWEEA